MAAADLHHLVVAAGLDGGEDLAGQHLAELGVAELVDELHTRTSATSAWTSSLSPSPTLVQERDLDRAHVAVGRLADREVAVEPHDAHLDRDVAAGEADVVVAVAHSITLALSSASSCS